MRIVSLVPSVTETLSAWDRTPIACTRFCERPDLRLVGGTKDPDIDLIVGLKPDLVIMDAEENRREDHEALVSAGINVHVLHVRSLLDVVPSMTGLAQVVAATWEGDVSTQPAPIRARAFIPIWRNPWIALGSRTYGSTLLAHLGIENVVGDDEAYPTVQLEDLRALRPDAVIAPSEPYPFSVRQLHELSSVAPTVFVDGQDLFWWGVRTPGAIERLRRVLEAGVKGSPVAGAEAR